MLKTLKVAALAVSEAQIGNTEAGLSIGKRAGSLANSHFASVEALIEAVPGLGDSACLAAVVEGWYEADAERFADLPLA